MLDDEKAKRIKELAARSRDRGIFTFTPFLSPSRLLEIPYLCDGVFYEQWGGASWAERKMVRFGNEDEIGYNADFPATILHVFPANKKFAPHLSHRDFLGALLSLGVEREKIGDIFVRDSEAYAAVSVDILPLITTELDSVGRTSVNVELADAVPDDFAPTVITETVTVSSLRADCVIAKAFNLSREKSIEAFRQNAVSISGKREENNSRLLKENDVVTVRGYGKIIYLGTEGVSKKEKLRIQIGRFSSKTD